MGERLHWRIANLLNRLPGQCWTDLVSWALDGMRGARRAGNNPLPWRPIGERCRNDANVSGDGRCYCCKIRANEEVPVLENAAYIVAGIGLCFGIVALYRTVRKFGGGR